MTRLILQCAILKYFHFMCRLCSCNMQLHTAYTMLFYRAHFIVSMTTITVIWITENVNAAEHEVVCNNIQNVKCWMMTDAASKVHVIGMQLACTTVGLLHYLIMHIQLFSNKTACIQHIFHSNPNYCCTVSTWSIST